MAENTIVHLGNKKYRTNNHWACGQEIYPGASCNTVKKGTGTASIPLDNNFDKVTCPGCSEFLRKRGLV